MNKNKAKQESKKRGHQLSSFSGVEYHDSIYFIATCKNCGSKIMVKDGQVQYGSVLEFECKGV